MTVDSFKILLSTKRNLFTIAHYSMIFYGSLTPVAILFIMNVFTESKLTNVRHKLTWLDSPLFAIYYSTPIWALVRVFRSLGCLAVHMALHISLPWRPRAHPHVFLSGKPWAPGVISAMLFPPTLNYFDVVPEQYAPYLIANDLHYYPWRCKNSKRYRI
jgi:hypothetical protein